MSSLPGKVDVAVIGGGTAGTIAALQAALAGAETALIECGPQLGGTITTGGVTFPGLFYAWGKQVIAGIGWDLVRRTVELDGGLLPDFRIPQPNAHWLHHVKLNGHLYAVLAEEAVLSAGVTLRYYTKPVRVETTSSGWRLTLQGKVENNVLECQHLIDCTGNAAVVGLAGFPLLRDEVTQPGTLMFRLGGYDVEKLDAELIQDKYEQSLVDGTLLPGDFQHSQMEFMHFLRMGGWNAQHIYPADSTTAESHTEANIAGRQSLLRLLRFVRSLPGCQSTHIETMAAETGVRETFRIEGVHQISVQEYCAGVQYDDAVCYSFYPIDLHDEDGILPQPLSEGVVPTIPLRALIPKGSRNLLAAGRCISSDRLANSALRVQASCMAMGQVAGGAAALAAGSNVHPLDVNLGDLKALLTENGAIVP